MTGLLLALLLGASEPRVAQRVPPVDQCASDEEFSVFRQELIAAVERRDSAFLLSIIAPNIEFSFGGDSGRERFVRSWKLDRPRSSGIWDELREVLRLGCAPGEDGTNWSPALFILENSGGDIFETWVAVAPDAVLRAAPDAAAPQIAELRWDVLAASLDRKGASRWLEASLGDGRRGFVRRDQVRSVIDYRAGFARVGGRWMMTVFIAGD